MINDRIFKKLNLLFNSCPKIEINDKDKFVIFSDVHLGNGGYQDDFKQIRNYLNKFLAATTYPEIIN